MPTKWPLHLSLLASTLLHSGSDALGRLSPCTVTSGVRCSCSGIGRALSTEYMQLLLSFVLCSHSNPTSPLSRC
ncbi:hypothetical protein V8C35DRAFT_223732 [Trichoderma chlorosporum]